MELSDREAVIRAVAGDRTAFDVLTGRYAGLLAGLAYTRLGEVEAARDAAQDALLAAYEQLDELADPAAFGPWLKGILVNQCALRLRGDTRRRTRDQTASARWLAEREPAPTAGEVLAEDERRRKLRSAIAELPEAEREIVTLRYLGGAGRREAAGLLGITVEAADKRLQRALEKLRENLLAQE